MKDQNVDLILRIISSMEDNITSSRLTITYLSQFVIDVQKEREEEKKDQIVKFGPKTDKPKFQIEGDEPYIAPPKNVKPIVVEEKSKTLKLKEPIVEKPVIEESVVEKPIVVEPAEEDDSDPFKEEEQEEHEPEHPIGDKTTINKLVVDEERYKLFNDREKSIFTTLMFTQGNKLTDLVAVYKKKKGKVTKRDLADLMKFFALAPEISPCQNLINALEGFAKDVMAGNHKDSEHKIVIEDNMNVIIEYVKLLGRRVSVENEMESGKGYEKDIDIPF